MAFDSPILHHLHNMKVKNLICFLCKNVFTVSDFYIPSYNLYLDPKNTFKQKKDLIKIERVINENDIKLIVDTHINIIEKLKFIINNTYSAGMM